MVLLLLVLLISISFAAEIIEFGTPKVYSIHIMDAKGQALQADVELRSVAGSLVTQSRLRQGVYDLYVKPKDIPVNEIVFKKVNINGDISLKLDTFDSKRFVQTYAIDPSLINFETAEVKVTAKGKALYKCKDWDFEAKVCKGIWIKIKDLTPGEEYTLTLTKDDPGFGEGDAKSLPSSALYNGANVTTNVTTSDNVYVDVNGTLYINWTNDLPPTNILSSNVTFEMYNNQSVDVYLFNRSTSSWDLLSTIQSDITERYVKVSLPLKTSDDANLIQIAINSTNATIDYTFLEMSYEDIAPEAKGAMFVVDSLPSDPDSWTESNIDSSDDSISWSTKDKSQDAIIGFYSAHASSTAKELYYPKSFAASWNLTGYERGTINFYAKASSSKTLDLDLFDSDGDALVTTLNLTQGWKFFSIELDKMKYDCTVGNGNCDGFNYGDVLGIYIWDGSSGSAFDVDVYIDGLHFDKALLYGRTVTAKTYYYDYDGDPESGSQLNWYNNSKYVSSGQTYTVSLAKCNNLTLEYIPSDGTKYGQSFNYTKTVKNTPPVAYAPTISPSVVYTDTDLVCQPSGAIDTDGDSVLTAVKWYINDSEILPNVLESYDRFPNYYGVDAKNATDFYLTYWTVTIVRRWDPRSQRYIYETTYNSRVREFSSVSGVRDVATVTSYDHNPGAVAYDGHDVWFYGSQNGKMYRLNLTSNSVDASFSVGFEPVDMDWNGTYLYVSDGLRVYKVNTTRAVQYGSLENGVDTILTMPVAHRGFATNSSDYILVDSDLIYIVDKDLSVKRVYPFIGEKEGGFRAATLNGGLWALYSGDLEGYLDKINLTQPYVLNSTFTQHFDVVRCGILPFDGEDKGEVNTSSPVIVLNTPPSISGCSINPSPAYTDSNLTASSIGYYDKDNDVESNSFCSWYVNDNFIENSTQLSYTNFNKHDIVKCIYYPSDGYDYGSPKECTITILNSEPTITSTSPANESIVNSLDFSITAADKDSDSLTYFFYVDQTDGTTLVGTSSDGTFTYTTSDGTYFWRVNVSDGEVNTTSQLYKVTLDTVKPIPSHISVNDTHVGSYAKFSALWNENVDLDYFIFSTNNTGVWVNDTAVSISGTSAYTNVTKTLNSTRGLEIDWIIYVWDKAGNMNSTGIQKLITTNNPPEARNVVIKPIDVYPYTNLTGEYMYYDQEGDPESGSLYRWYKNGKLLPGETSTTLEANFTIDDNVTFEVTPYDGFDYGQPVNYTVTVKSTCEAPSEGQWRIYNESCSLTNVDVVVDGLKVDKDSSLEIRDSKYTLIINGNLIVDGNLTISNSTVKFNCTSSGACGVLVESTGNLIIDNDSYITSLNSNTFFFEVYGKLHANNSTFEKLYFDATTVHGGIQLYSNSNVVKNSLFKQSDGAMYASWANNTIFEGNTILQSYNATKGYNFEAVGIYVENSKNLSFKGNALSGTPWGIALYKVQSSYVEDNVIENTTGGIYIIETKDLTVKNNTISKLQDAAVQTGNTDSNELYGNAFTMESSENISLSGNNVSDGDRDSVSVYSLRNSGSDISISEDRADGVRSLLVFGYSPTISNLSIKRCTFTNVGGIDTGTDSVLLNYLLDSNTMSFSSGGIGVLHANSYGVINNNTLSTSSDVDYLVYIRKGNVTNNDLLAKKAVLITENITLTNNVIHAQASGSRGIDCSSGVGTIENNTIYNYQYGVYYRGCSYNLTSNEIYNNTYGVYLPPQSVRLKDNHIYENTYGIYTSQGLDSVNNTFCNNIITDLYSNYNNSLAAFNTSNYFCAGSKSGYRAYNIFNNYRVYVVDQNNQPVGDAVVRIENSTSDLVSQLTTYSSGYTPYTNIKTDILYNNGLLVASNPHTLKVSKPYYYSNTTSTSITSNSQTDTVSITYAPCTYFGGDWILIESCTLNNEDLTINGNIEVPENITLTLNSTTLRMNSSYDGEHNITVYGKLVTLNGSLITNETKRYDIFIYGNMSVDNTTIEKYKTFEVWSKNVNITNSILKGGDDGLRAYSSDLNLENTTAVGISTSVYAYNSTLNLRNLTLEDSNEGLFAYNSSVSADGLKINYNNKSITLSKSYLVFTSGNISYNGRGIYAVDSNVSVQSTAFCNNSQQHVYALNTTFNTSAFGTSNSFCSGDATKERARKEWYYSVKVVDSIGQPIEGAKVELYNSTSDLILTQYTNSQGTFDEVNIVQDRIDGSGVYHSATPHTVVASRLGFQSNTTSTTINVSKVDVITLQDTCVYPSNGDWVVSTNMTCVGRNIVINGNVTISPGAKLTLRSSTLSINASEYIPTVTEIKIDVPDSFIVAYETSKVNLTCDRPVDIWWEVVAPDGTAKLFHGGEGGAYSWGGIALYNSQQRYYNLTNKIVGQEIYNDNTFAGLNVMSNGTWTLRLTNYNRPNNCVIYSWNITLRDENGVDHVYNNTTGVVVKQPSLTNLISYGDLDVIDSKVHSSNNNYFMFKVYGHIYADNTTFEDLATVKYGVKYIGGAGNSILGSSSLGPGGLQIYSDSNTIRNSNISNTQERTLWLEGSSFNLIENNFFDSNGYSIVLASAYDNNPTANNTFRYNTFDGTRSALNEKFFVVNNTFYKNTFIGSLNDRAVDLSNTYYARTYPNYFIDNVFKGGIAVSDQMGRARFINNTFNGLFRVRAYGYSFIYECYIINNTFNNSGLYLDPYKGGSWLKVVNNTFVNPTTLYIRGAYNYLSNVLFSGNVVNNTDSVFLSRINSVNITSNNITNARMRVSSVSDSIIHNNMIINATKEDGALEVLNSHANITNNTILNSPANGIYGSLTSFSYSSHLNITGNRICNSSGYGIYLEDVTFDPSNLSANNDFSCEYNHKGRVSVAWSVRAHTMDQYGNDLPGAEVTAVNNTNDKVFSSYTEYLVDDCRDESKWTTINMTMTTVTFYGKYHWKMNATGNNALAYRSLGGASGYDYIKYSAVNPHLGIPYFVNITYTTGPNEEYYINDLDTVHYLKIDRYRNLDKIYFYQPQAGKIIYLGRIYLVGNTTGHGTSGWVKVVGYTVNNTGYKRDATPITFTAHRKGYNGNVVSLSSFTGPTTVDITLSENPCAYNGNGNWDINTTCYVHDIVEDVFGSLNIQTAGNVTFSRSELRFYAENDGGSGVNNIGILYLIDSWVRNFIGGHRIKFESSGKLLELNNTNITYSAGVRLSENKKAIFYGGNVTDSSSHGLMLYNSTDNLVQGTLFSSSNGYGIYALNSSLNKDVANLSSFVSNSLGRVKVDWYLKVRTEDETGTPIESADVKVIDQYNTTTSLSTDANGETPTTIFTEYVVNNSGGMEEYSPYKISASKTNHKSNSTTTDLNESKVVLLILNTDYTSPSKAPVLTVKSTNTSDPTGWSSEYVNLTWTEALDDRGIYFYEVVRNEGANSVSLANVSNSTFNYVDTAVQSDKEYSYYIVAYDKAYNTNTSNVESIKIDRNAPNITITDPANGSTVSSPVTFKVSYSDYSETNCYIAFDSNTTYNLMSNSGLTSGVATYSEDFTEGTHTAHIKCVDYLGHENSTNVTFYNIVPPGGVYDETPPTTYCDSDGLYHNETYTVNLTCNDEDFSYMQYCYSTDTCEPTTSTTDNPVRLTFEPENANYTIRFRSIDTNGNEESIKECIVRMVSCTPFERFDPEKGCVPLELPDCSSQCAAYDDWYFKDLSCHCYNYETLYPDARVEPTNGTSNVTFMYYVASQDRTVVTRMYINGELVGGIEPPPLPPSPPLPKPGVHPIAVESTQTLQAKSTNVYTSRVFEPSFNNFTVFQAGKIIDMDTKEDGFGESFADVSDWDAINGEISTDGDVATLSCSSGTATFETSIPSYYSNIEIKGDYVDVEQSDGKLKIVLQCPKTVHLDAIRLYDSITEYDPWTQPYEYRIPVRVASSPTIKHYIRVPSNFIVTNEYGNPTSITSEGLYYIYFNASSFTNLDLPDDLVAIPSAVQKIQIENYPVVDDILFDVESVNYSSIIISYNASYATGDDRDLVVECSFGNDTCVGSNGQCVISPTQCADEVVCRAYDPKYSNIYYPGSIVIPVDRNNPIICGLCGGELVGSVCCGDESGEYPIYKIVQSDTTTTSVTTDEACCASSTACVNSQVCYSSGSSTVFGNVEYTCNNNVWVPGAQPSSGGGGGPGGVTRPTVGDIRLVSTEALEPEAKPNQNVTFVSKLCNYGKGDIPGGLSVEVYERNRDIRSRGKVNTTIPKGYCGDVIWTSIAPEEGYVYTPIPEVKISINQRSYTVPPAYPILQPEPKNDIVGFNEKVYANISGVVFVNNTYVKANLTDAVLKVYSPEGKLVYSKPIGYLPDKGIVVGINPTEINAIGDRYLIVVEASAGSYVGNGGSSFLQGGFIVPQAGQALGDYLKELNK